MIYPPIESVFYRLNPIESVSSEKRQAFNPLLTSAEIEALYKSFHIQNQNKMIRQQISADCFEEKTFAQIIHETLVFANRLPTARLWLRSIPAGITFSCADLKNLNGATNGNEVILSQCIVQKPARIFVTTFMHELAHVIDRKQCVPISPHPFEPINAGEASAYQDYQNLTETQTIRFFLIEEAEKAALGAQIAFEADAENQRHYIYTPLFQKAFSHYLKVFQNLSFDPRQYTPLEIERERKIRALYYASLNAQADYIKWLLKPYSFYVRQMPKAVRAQLNRSSRIAALLCFDHIKKMKLTDSQLGKTAELIGKIFDSWGYQARANNFLFVGLFEKFQHLHLAEKMPTKRAYEYFISQIDKLDFRRQFNNSENDQFNAYAHLMEGRYLGFLKAEDLMPRLDSLTVYIRQSKNNPNNALIHFALSSQINQMMMNHLKKQVKTYFDPYYYRRRCKECLKSERQR